MEAAKKKLLEYKAMVVKDDGKSPKGYWKPIGRRAHIRLRPEQLVALYNGEIRGFYEYYSLAHNIGNFPMWITFHKQSSTSHTQPLRKG